MCMMSVSEGLLIYHVIVGMIPKISALAEKRSHSSDSSEGI